jgi:hypothetical protein
MTLSTLRFFTGAALTTNGLFVSGYIGTSQLCANCFFLIGVIDPERILF